MYIDGFTFINKRSQLAIAMSFGCLLQKHSSVYFVCDTIEKERVKMFETLKSREIVPVRQEVRLEESWNYVY
jgi:hypothetical protein